MSARLEKILSSVFFMGLGTFCLLLGGATGLVLYSLVFVAYRTAFQSRCTIESERAQYIGLAVLVLVPVGLIVLIANDVALEERFVQFYSDSAHMLGEKRGLKSFAERYFDPDHPLRAVYAFLNMHLFVLTSAALLWLNPDRSAFGNLGPITRLDELKGGSGFQPTVSFRTFAFWLAGFLVVALIPILTRKAIGLNHYGMLFYSGYVLLLWMVMLGARWTSKI